MKNKNKLIFIGPLRMGELPHSGDTMKNRLFLDRFMQEFDKVYTVDTYNWQRKPQSLIILMIYLMFIRRAKVVVSCEASASKIIDFLYYFRLQTKVFYWVVGSGFVDRIEKGVLPPNHYRFLKAILVQSPKMVQTLQKAGLNNAYFIPNSKPIYNIQIQKHDTNKTRFVFVSRILPEKGLDYIFNCLKRLNGEGFSGRISIDFYGIVKEHYLSFLEQVELFPNAKYKGLLNLTSMDGYNTLSSYDVMLFPTYYDGEGFPGVFIDAFISGLPVIATDWHYNSEVVRDGETGFIIPPKDEDALYEKMKWVISNRNIIESYRSNCIEEAKKYDRNAVLSLSNLRSIGLIE